MSVRAANYPLEVPSGINIDIKEKIITVKGPKGTLSYHIHPTVVITKVDLAKNDSPLNFSTNDKVKNGKFLGTSRALIKNMIKGVSEGFVKKLDLHGVGYKAQVNANNLELVLGFSHPLHYPIPKDIVVTVEKQTSITIQGIDKQKVGQVAAEIKAFRPVEPYKGKGVRYSDQKVIKKEVKKK